MKRGEREGEAEETSRPPSGGDETDKRIVVPSGEVGQAPSHQIHSIRVAPVWGRGDVEATIKNTKTTTMVMSKQK